MTLGNHILGDDCCRPNQRLRHDLNPHQPIDLLSNMIVRCQPDPWRLFAAVQSSSACHSLERN